MKSAGGDFRTIFPSKNSIGSYIFTAKKSPLLSRIPFKRYAATILTTRDPHSAALAPVDSRAKALVTFNFSPGHHPFYRATGTVSIPGKLMKNIVRCVVCLAAAIAALCAAEKKPLTNSDVVKMAKAELPDSTIVLAIKSGAPAFDTTPEALIALKSAGISAAVIEAMLTARAAPSDAVEPPTELEVGKNVAGLASTQSEGVLVFVDFTKTDGQMINESGRQYYVMDFDALIRVREDCIWRNVTIEPQLTFRVARKSQAGNSGGGWGDFLYVSQNPGLQARGGSVLRVSGQTRLEKAESGWRVTSMIHKGITVGSDSDITQAQGMKNAAKKKAVATVTEEELSALVAMAAPSPTTENEVFTSLNGKVSARSPVGFKVEKGNGDVVGRFFRENGNSPLSITVTCATTPLFNRNQSLQSLLVVTMAAVRDANPGAVLTPSVPSKLSGVDAATFVFTVVEHGKVMQKAATVAICRKHSLGVVMHSTPEEFKKAWDAYRLVCDTYVLAEK